MTAVIFDLVTHLLVFMRLYISSSINDPLSDSPILLLTILSLSRMVFFKKVWYIGSTSYLILVQMAYQYLVFDSPTDKTFYPLTTGSLILSLFSTRSAWRVGQPEQLRFSEYCRQMLKLLRPERGALVFGCCVLVVRLPFSLAMPHFVSAAVAALVDRDGRSLGANVKWMTVCGSIDAFLDFFCVYLFARIQLKITNSLKQQVFSHMLHLPMTFHDSQVSGDLLSRLTNDCNSCASELSWTVRWTLEAVVRVSGVLMYMFLTSSKLAVLCLLVIPFNAVLGHVYGTWSAVNANRAQTALGAATGAASEALSAVATVKTFNQMQKEQNKFGASLNENFRFALNEAFYRGCYYGLVNTFCINTATQSLLLYYAWLLIEKNAINNAGVLAFLFYRGQLQDYANSVIAQYISVVRATGIGKRIFDILNTPLSDSVLPPRLLHVRREAQHGSAVEFVNVGMQYAQRSSRRVLNGLSFRVNAGQKLAILGKSGAGKSSILALLLNLYRRESGRILIDDCLIEHYSTEELQSVVSIVSQEPVLFRGTIRENILYGGGTVDEARLKEAMDIACVTEFVNGLPDKLETRVGERGTQLSGGQKQRIAIARAVVMNPRVLLLDEATSALDAEAEEIVHTALQRAMCNRTVIMVSHRVASILKYADYAIVVENGKIVSQGLPNEILNSQTL